MMKAMVIRQNMANLTGAMRSCIAALAQTVKLVVHYIRYIHAKNVTKTRLENEAVDWLEVRYNVTMGCGAYTCN
jgi:hypothetical protein